MPGGACLLAWRSDTNPAVDGASYREPHRLEVVHEEPTDPGIGHRLLRATRRIRLPVLWLRVARLRLVRRSRRSAAIRVRRTVGMVRCLRRVRVDDRRLRALG